MVDCGPRGGRWYGSNDEKLAIIYSLENLHVALEITGGSPAD